MDPGFTGTVDVPDRRAFVFQEPRLLSWKRVVDNVRLGRRGASAKLHAQAALEPELLLLDEPFGALDALTRIRMHVLLQELCARHHPAVLLVTHDVDEAILLADRIVVLADGQISLDVDVAIGAPRMRADHAFDELRSRLLAALGIDELAEGARA